MAQHHSAWQHPYPLMAPMGRVMGPPGTHQMPPFGGRGRMPHMPPPSNYSPLPKQENREYAQLMPGQAVVKKGYNKSPISAKGKQLMATYEKVMARPQGSFPYMSGKGQEKKPCHFHASAQGCRNGASCRFSHEGVMGGGAAPGLGLGLGLGGGGGGKGGGKGGGGGGSNTAKIPCRNFPGSCNFGTKCKFMHAQ